MARRVEELGYAVLSPGDHIPFMGPIAAITAAAAATTTLRVGSMTFSNDFRHPLMLAQEAATIDVLSGGRMEIAIGAGWDANDYVTMGLPMERPGVRIDRMAESIAIIKAYFTGETFSFHGEHYTVTEAAGRVRAVQQPRPPLVVGGGGRRVLTLAAREADVVAVNAVLAAGDFAVDRKNSARLDDTRPKVALVREVAGDRFEEIELGIYVHVAKVVDDASDLDRAAVEVAREMNLSVDDTIDSPHALVGTATQVADKLQRMRDEFCISYVSIDAVSIEEMAPVVALLTGT
jgi:probable F420-dependent oxidoreductase